MLFTEKAREAPPFRAGEESAGSANGGTGLHFDSVCGSIVFSPGQDWASVKKPIAVRSRKGVPRKRNLELQAPAFRRGVLTIDGGTEFTTTTGITSSQLIPTVQIIARSAGAVSYVIDAFGFRMATGRS